MLPFTLAFLSGIVALQYFSHLPGNMWVVIIILLVLSLQLVKKFPSKNLLTAFALGLAWAIFYAHLQLSWVLPDDLEGKPVKLIGYIASIPDIHPHQTAFLFSLTQLQFENRIQSVQGRIHLSWQNPPVKLHVGDQWQLVARLKKIHGQMNPGGFDYEAWSFQEGIRANGSVYTKAEPSYLRLGNAWYYYPIARLREFFRDKIQKYLAQTHVSPWITALAIGERQNIPADDWQVLRNTGTNHLMAIAGLHIGFMAGFAYGVVGWLWRHQRKLCLLLPAQHAGAVSALIIALLYSAMAGFSIPTQRACIMLSVYLLLVLSRRHVTAWQVWGIALLSVLLWNPLSVLTDSFWLSFISVALIIYGIKGRLAPKGIWWKHGRIQWVIAVGLIPISVWLFHEFSLVSFLANSIAIPWVGFLILPFTLCGCFFLLFSPKLGSLLLWLAAKSLAILWSILSYFSHLSWAAWYPAVPHIGFILLACIGMVILLLPRGFPGRWFGIIGLLPLLLYQPSGPKAGEVVFTLLDVGQGLSAVVQTQKHLLVFDAGPRLSENNDMGESVVVPFLRTLGVNHLDRLVISHGDNDHIGGAGAILKQIPTYLVQSSVPEHFTSMPASYCLLGEHWQWDQVQFEFLYPSLDKLGLDNNSSCVLRISAGQQQILLTGDIEKLAEQYLISNAANELSAAILVAPHHGSKTSALDEFIRDVNPRIVLFPVGYRNRYHFPHPSVVEKYRTLGIIAYDTVQAGAIQFHLTSNHGRVKKPLLYRLQNNQYWRNYSL
jgi:competence protein ComEC